MSKINSSTNSALELENKSKNLELKNLEKKLNRKISNKENEIESMNNFYKQKKSALNNESLIGLEKIRGNNQERIHEESQRYEDKMQSYSQKLETIQESISKEEASLRNNKNNQLRDLKIELDADFEAQSRDAIDNQIERSNVTKDIVSLNNQKAKQEKANIQDNTSREIELFTTQQDIKLNTNQQHYNKINSDFIKKNENETISLQRQLRSEREVNDKKNKRINLAVDQTNEQEIGLKQKYHQNKLQQIDSDFKVKYENISKVHNEMLQNISKKLDDDIKKVVDKNAIKKDVIDVKSQDEFYRVSLLRPKIIELPEEVLISLPVADYEKNNVFLSANDRNIKITLSRNYSDKIKDIDSSTNKSTRSELFSKELTTEDILNPRSITQKYENGIISFRILKA